jgi:hypothetical protein
MSDSDFLPTNPIVREATLRLKKLKGVPESAVEGFSDALAASSASMLQARADIVFVVFYGNLTVKVQTAPYTKKYFDVDSWGLGAAGGTAFGGMYTGYDNWDSFFKNVTSYHVQGFADGGGLLQVTWFISNGTPVGQFNGGMVGAAGIEAGGSGKWAG